MKFLIASNRKKNEELTFKSFIDGDGDFRVQCSADGEKWVNLIFISKDQGTLGRFAGARGLLGPDCGLKLEDCGRIELYSK